MKSSLQAFKFTLSAPQGISVWFIFMLTINGLIGILAQPHQLAAVGTGKDEQTCRIGMAAGNFIKRFCTIGWALVGLLVAAMIARNAIPGATLKDPEDAFGFACHFLLFPGALGLLIACVLAATMAACSAFMVDSGALFTQGLYRRYLAPGRSDQHYLWVGRFSGFGITMLGVLYTIFLIDKVLYSFLLTETMATFMGISLTAGLVWKRANRWGALSSIIVAFAVNFALYARSGQRLDNWDPDVFLYALLAGYAALVIVSLITAPEPAEKIRDLFARFDVSTDLTSGLSKQAGAEGKSHELQGLAEDQIESLRRKTSEAGQELIFSSIVRLRRPKGSVPLLKACRQDIVGLIYCWGVVALLVGIAWAILQL